MKRPLLIVMLGLVAGVPSLRAQDSSGVTLRVTPSPFTSSKPTCGR